MNFSERHKEIKVTFPDFPDDVVDQWLVPHSERMGFGWPPDMATDWRYVLCNRSIAWCKKLQWTLETARLTEITFTANGTNKFLKMILAAGGERNEYSILPELQKRIKGPLDFVRENKRLPRIPVAIKEGEGLNIVDGNHRICAALMYCGKLPDPTDFEIEIWVGTCATA